MLIPVLQYPDGTYRGETTMLAYDLEARHQGRSVIPEDKAVAFVCDLLEDLADEWAGDSDNSCSSYRGVTLQHRFDLTRQYLLTAANDDIRLSTENAYIPLGVYYANVTRIVPAIISESPTVRG